jgi:hypothetical protein
MTDDVNHAHMVKIWFKLDPKRWHRHSSESLWAEPLAHASESGAYRLMNSPLHVDGISFLDIVHAAPGRDGVLMFGRVIRRSGHSTFMLLVPPDSSSFGEYWEKLRQLGCSHEWGEQKTSMGKRILYSVDVPETSDLGTAMQILDEGEKRGVWMYQVGHKARSTT